MNILFMHNTLPEYRINWFKEISKLAKCKFIFTNEKLNKQVYGTKIKYDKVRELDTLFLKKGLNGYIEIINEIKHSFNYDFVLFPPIDSIRELLISMVVYNKCKRNSICTGYFWEKWEAPKDLQPFVRKVKNGLIKNAASYIFKRVDLVFAGGSKSREYFCDNGVDPSKIIVLPDSSEVPECEYINIRQLYGIKDDKTIILYFGRIFDQKGLDILLKAIGMIENQEDYFLIIAGDGNYRLHCEELVKKLDLKCVRFVGAVDPEKRKNYFEQSDIFVFPGTYRGGRVDVWGLTLNEAMQFNNILISTDAVGSAYDLIDNGVNGYMVESENVNQLCQAIKESSQKIDINKLKLYNDKMKQRYNFSNMASVFINAIEDKICR